MMNDFNHHTLACISALIATLAASSCGSNGCEEVRETYCIASCQSASDKTLSKVSIWGLGQGIKNDSVQKEDSILIDGLSNPSDLTLILNPNDSISRFKMQLDGVESDTQIQEFDTLTVLYEPFPYFINMDCGCSVFFTLKEVQTTTHFFKNATIKQAHINNEDKINLILEY